MTPMRPAPQPSARGGAFLFGGWRKGALTVAGWLAVVLLLGACGGRGPAPGGTVRIDSAPIEGVPVIIGDELVGETPFLVEGYPPGRMVVNLVHPLYRPVAEMIEIPAAGTDERVLVTLRPQEAYLSVDSDPPGAAVELEGIGMIGVTPFYNRSIPPGEHTYVIEVANHRSETNSFTAETDFRYQFTHALTPMPGRVEVVSDPPFANIWINEEERAGLTPAEFELFPGLYRIAVHTDNHIMAEEVVELGPNEHRTIQLQMEPGNAPRGMVLIPAGYFIFGVSDGAPDEHPQQRIHLDAFYIDRYPVTNAQFKEVFPSHIIPDEMENHPVTGVSFRVAQEYARRVGKRLPTEQEWEKAARGTDGRQYPWGNTFRREFVNSAEQAPGVEPGLRPVGQFRGGASPFGVMDMAGNVYEWTASWYGPYPGNEEISADYGQIYRVLRGGSFRSNEYDVRAPRRHFNLADAARDDYGFRCAKDAKDDE